MHKTYSHDLFLLFDETATTTFKLLYVSYSTLDIPKRASDK